MVFLYVTYPNRTEAKKAAKLALAKKLCACANLIPIEAIYNWKGKLCEEKETALIFKTTKAKESLLRKEIEKIHSYDICCIASLGEIKGNKNFEDWINKEVK